MLDHFLGRVQLHSILDGEGTVSIADVYWQHEEKSPDSFDSTFHFELNVFYNATSIYSWVTSSSILELSPAEKEVYKKVLFRVKLVCKIYDVPFQKLIEAGKQLLESFKTGECSIWCSSLQHSLDCSLQVHSITSCLSSM